jgi:hypothetical protein
MPSFASTYQQNSRSLTLFTPANMRAIPAPMGQTPGGLSRFLCRGALRTGEAPTSPALSDDALSSRLSIVPRYRDVPESLSNGLS